MAIVAVVFLAKGAIAEPFYVPSGSMEPTLLIGDALVASKFPYGYGTASLPVQITLPETGRLFGETPKRGDVVVFRWPGDRSQAWVKRVVGLPGDRIQMRQGQLFINDHPATLKADGIGQAEDDRGTSEEAYRYIETLPNGVTHAIFKMRDNGRLDNTPEVTVPAGQSVRARRQQGQFRRQPRLGARRRRRAVADRQSDRPRRRRGRLLGHGHTQPAGVDLAVRLFASRGSLPPCSEPFRRNSSPPRCAIPPIKSSLMNCSVSPCRMRGSCRAVSCKPSGTC